MWPWQQSVQFKYLVFWGQLLTLVAVIHVMVLYGFLFIQHGINLHDNLTITARFVNGDLPVVFMPFYKHVPGAIQQINTQVANNSKKQDLIKNKNNKIQNNSNSKPIVYKLVKPEISKKVVPKIIKPKLSKNSAKVGISKIKLTVKSAPKLAKVKPVIKKLKPAIAKKTSEIIPMIPETLQDSIKPVGQILPESPEKISSKMVVSELKQVASVETKSLDSKQVASSELGDTNKNNLNNNLSVTNLSASNNNISNKSTSATISSSNINHQELAIGRKDLELLQLQDSLRGAVSQNWRPPLGFKRDLETIVEVFVGPAGLMEHVDIKQSSGVLVFDASVELAINQVVWPSEAWGKSHTLTFKQ